VSNFCCGRVRQTALSWMKRVKALEGGDALDSLSTSELKELVATLEMGVQRAKSALTFQEQESIANKKLT
jgi:uncharacterized small protein (DUF1192 family)